ILGNDVPGPRVEPGPRDNVVLEWIACERIIDHDRRAEEPASGRVDSGSQQRGEITPAEVRVGPPHCVHAFFVLSASLVIKGPERLVADEGTSDESSKLVTPQAIFLQALRAGWLLEVQEIVFRVQLVITEKFK